MTRPWRWLAVLLLLAGCSGPGAGLGFVVNRTTGAAEAQGRGKSYSLPKASLSQVGNALMLQAEDGPTRVVLAIPCPEKDAARLLGRTLPLIKEGSALRMDGTDHAVTDGQVAFQSARSGVYRGNFNVKLGDGLEAVGNFEATAP